MTISQSWEAIIFVLKFYPLNYVQLSDSIFFVPFFESRCQNALQDLLNIKENASNVSKTLLNCYKMFNTKIIKKMNSMSQLISLLG